ncbi:endonuclease NucS domain-containing protein [Nocardioides sp. P86]|uniref:endonuclease NucS domain-containing protein n=1 Tax=Nocardioides sp. P86 TaxID=2939569 RepID=UPI00203BB6B3|nr:endonuclease NucS domain-containing protein [Nocardioides sp. P86]MCM3516595.1 endonuclease NucS [Nocardioides sp. P86]
MTLYDMTAIKSGLPSTSAALVEVTRTSFAEEGIQERSHLQAALRDHIDLIDHDLHVIAEEFGDFEGANRRIDLLCIDKNCKLVVVELKRTVDGGHMELQALRYAAMVSTMTFAQVVRAFAKYRKGRGDADHSEEDARDRLLAWLALDDEELVIPREVGVVLASEDFSQEITTTVLWLNEFYGFDIRCVRLSPYRLEDRLLLDVQHVIPLPEASEYTVRVREKEIAVKQAKESGADWTKFVVQSPTSTTKPLPKRWAVLELVKGLAEAGVAMEHVSRALPDSKILHVTGTYPDSEALWAAIQTQLGKPDPRRWHLAHPIVEGDKTWVVHSNWGTQTRDAFKQLLDLAPGGFAVYEEGDEPTSLG